MKGEIMLLHLEPRCVSPFRDAALVDLTIEPFGLRLVGGVDLITGHPYPNKHHAVACRKTRTGKAFYGLLIEICSPVDEWRVTARWGIDGVRTPVTHEIDYRLLDHDFDAASDNGTFWHGTWAGPWTDRSPSSGACGCPRMEILSRWDEAKSRATCRDTVVPVGDGWLLIVKRCETVELPTIERGRLFDGKHYVERPDRMPPLEAAFQVLPVDPGESAENQPSRPISSKTQGSVAPGCVRMR